MVVLSGGSARTVLVCRRLVFQQLRRRSFGVRLSYLRTPRWQLRAVSETGGLRAARRRECRRQSHFWSFSKVTLEGMPYDAVAAW